MLSAVTGDFGTTIPQYYQLAVFITAPLELRIERIQMRAFEKYGKRVCEGGDMYIRHQKFMDFVTTRSLSRIEQWAENLTCPVINIDGTVDWRISAVKIAEIWKARINKS